MPFNTNWTSRFSTAVRAARTDSKHEQNEEHTKREISAKNYGKRIVLCIA